MSNKSILKTALTDFVRRKSLALNAVACQVKKVDKDAGTCDCEPLNKTPLIFGVRLIAETKKGVLILPKEGSVVIVSYLAEGPAFVAMFGEVEEIQLMGDTLGGLTKTPELKKQLDKMNKQLQVVIDSLSGWTTVPNDGGAALQTYFNLKIVGKTEANFDEIENEKIKHGDGT